VPGLKYRLRDAKSNKVTGYLSGDYEKWLDCEMVFIPANR